MTEKTKTSITDIPKKAGEKDTFGIDRFEKGLIRFIKNTDTPITIALQGEWGSGKTSLMNSLKSVLCDTENNFHPVWLNTWQYSLMRSPDQVLISIIKGLTEEVLHVIKKDQSAFKSTTDKLSRVFGKVLSATTKIAVKATTGEDASELINIFSDDNRETTILELREELNNTIAEILKTSEKKGFIFFIDDLDRIDPPVAVSILELLKNIFDLDNCVFILAIDYEVVIKGLEPKYGTFGEKNEREFRSFFDKIIQLPFTMPVTSYEIEDFLMKSLISINYINSTQAAKSDFIKHLTLIANLSVGTNPRSLKRLLNSLSLISCINAENNDKSDDQSQLDDELQLIVNFALVSIQIAFPQVYRLLYKKPDFPKWDNQVAVQLNLSELEVGVAERINKLAVFDEVWEQVLFRFCEKDYYLKKNALNISKLLNALKDIISNDNQNTDVGEVIESVISLSSVTNVEAIEKTDINYHASSFLKNLRGSLIAPIEKLMPVMKGVKMIHNGKVRSNAFIHFVPEGTNWPWIRLRSWPENGKVKLQLLGEHWFGQHGIGNFLALMDKSLVINDFNALNQSYMDLVKEYPDFTFLSLENHVTKNYNSFVVHLFAYISLARIDDFNDTQNINKISRVVVEMYQHLLKVADLDSRINIHFEKNKTLNTTSE